MSITTLSSRPKPNIRVTRCHLNAQVSSLFKQLSPVFSFLGHATARIIELARHRFNLHLFINSIQIRYRLFFANKY